MLTMVIGRLKRHSLWLVQKVKIDCSDHKPPLVSVGDVWWASIGENVGKEIHGKSEKFTRPVIVYKKLSHEMYLVIPTSTKQKIGTWYVPYKHQGIDAVACLHQVRVIDYRRLHSSKGMLDGADFERIKEAFKSLYL